MAMLFCIGSRCYTVLFRTTNAFIHKAQTEIFPIKSHVKLTAIRGYSSSSVCNTPRSGMNASGSENYAEWCSQWINNNLRLSDHSSESTGRPNLTPPEMSGSIIVTPSGRTTQFLLNMRNNRSLKKSTWDSSLTSNGLRDLPRTVASPNFVM